jgi:bifunctional DNase/RNase
MSAFLHRLLTKLYYMVNNRMKMKEYQALLGNNGGNMYTPMVISGLTVDPITNSPIVILKEEDGDGTLPIWIGLLEATAIASEMEGIKFSRPMTHDLLKNMIEMVDAKVGRIEICDLKDNTYYALIHFEHNGKEMSIDARPSDAIALSLRLQIPILVSREVITRSTQIDLKAEPQDKSEKGKKWQEILENLNPEDFGKYRM